MVVGSSIACKGNGKTLGMTNGSGNYGVFLSTNEPLILSVNAYNTNIGTTGITNILRVGKTLGITTEADKSGVVADVSGLPTLNWAIKF